MSRKHEYAEIEKRVSELGALLDSELVKLGKFGLLLEHGKLCEKLYRRDTRNRIVSDVLYYCLLFSLGFLTGVILVGRMLASCL